VITDQAVYHAGQRRSGTLELEPASAPRDQPDSFVWVDLHEPTAEELARLQAGYSLHPLAVEDTYKDHKRPKMSVHDDVLCAVVKTARYVEPEGVIALGQIVLFAGPWFVVSVSYGIDGSMAAVRKELEARPELLRNGPCTVVYAIVDRVVDDYVGVLGGLDTDLREVEREVFSPGTGQPAERIYRLKREVLEFQRATAPLADMIIHLAAGRYPVVPASVRAYFGSVEDRLLRVVEEVERDSALLTSMLEANSTQVAMRQNELALEQARISLEQNRITLQQNEDVRKISAWVAIVAVPTMIAGIYGMNFEHMPELRWPLGYPAVLAVMAGACVLVYRLFRRSGWL
jgi:magnesium transporter